MGYQVHLNVKTTMYHDYGNLEPLSWWEKYISMTIIQPILEGF